MASKKTATGKTPARKATASSAPAKKAASRRAQAALKVGETPAKIADSITESTRNIWLAGIGALGRAQIEGSKLFESLVTEGAGLESNARHYVDDKIETTRETVNEQVKDARARASTTWNKFEAAFEERVQRTLTRLGIPTRDEVDALHAKIDALSARPIRTPARKAPAKAAKKATKKAAKAPAAAPVAPTPATPAAPE